MADKLYALNYFLPIHFHDLPGASYTLLQTFCELPSLQCPHFPILVATDNPLPPEWYQVAPTQ